MNQLSKEAIEAIYNQIDKSVSNRNDMILGCKEALTNPEIYEKAGLVKDNVEWFPLKAAQYLVDQARGKALNRSVSLTGKFTVQDVLD